MPHNQRRSSPVRRARPRLIPPHLRSDLRIEASFDRASYGTGIVGPPLLYHYTSWEAAERIIQSQRFWATAHDCTNDQEELVYADATILEAVRAAEVRSSGLSRRLLRLFHKTYSATRIGASHRTYLVCFSKHRDDPNQWREYGRDGAGVCLGLRLFGIPHPVVPNIATSFMPVTYGDVEVRQELDECLDQFTGVMERIDPPDREETWRNALDFLNVPAAAWALSTKAPKWRDEHEVRMIFLVRDGQTVAPNTRIRPDGREHRSIAVPVTRLPRVPVEEFIVGANQDAAAGTARALRLLNDLKYRNPDRRVIVSNAPDGIVARVAGVDLSPKGTHRTAPVGEAESRSGA